MITNEMLEDEMLDQMIELEKTLIDDELSGNMARKFYEWLVELKERRATELKPATKYLTNSWLEQYMHVKEELDEVRQAMNDYALGAPCSGTDHISEELVDLQMSCETMLAIIGLDEQQRNEARRKVIKKNKERGYYGG